MSFTPLEIFVRTVTCCNLDPCFPPDAAKRVPDAIFNQSRKAAPETTVRQEIEARLVPPVLLEKNAQDQVRGKNAAKSNKQKHFPPLHLWRDSPIAERKATMVRKRTVLRLLALLFCCIAYVCLLRARKQVLVLGKRPPARDAMVALARSNTSPTLVVVAERWGTRIALRVTRHGRCRCRRYRCWVHRLHSSLVLRVQP